MSNLKLDYANCLSDRVGKHGIELTTLNDAQPSMAKLTEKLNASKGTQWERWRSLPFDPMRGEHVDAVNKLVSKLKDNTEHLIILGIGGSALGNIALHSALTAHNHNLLDRKDRNGPRVYILDNVDPLLVGQTLDFVRKDDPSFKRTVINVISKSGETAETAAAFMIFRSLLKAALGDAHKDHIVAVTDPVKGTMREICDNEGYATLPVPDGVGGRFSVLSPVGLFSAAMCGIDINALLDGAADMDKRCCETDMKQNPAAMLAWILMQLTKQGKINHVLMPYCNSLYLLADWFRQLWAESLGKRVDTSGKEVFTGATPIKALGTTDQHSQVQLYREGPNDKVIGFVDVKSFDSDVQVPSDLEAENLSYLRGIKLSELLAAEKTATEFALVESQRPNFTITFPKLNAYHVGEFIALWEITTSYAGLLLNIDAYDQPAVETGKVATFGLMGRAGYDEWKTKVAERLGKSDKVI